MEGYTITLYKTQDDYKYGRGDISKLSCSYSKAKKELLSLVRDRRYSAGALYRSSTNEKLYKIYHRGIRIAPIESELVPEGKAKDRIVSLMGNIARELSADYFSILLDEEILTIVLKQGIKDHYIPVSKLPDKSQLIISKLVNLCIKYVGSSLHSISFMEENYNKLYICNSDEEGGCLDIAYGYF